MARLAVDADLALVRLQVAGEDVHQRRFAGAVLADDGVDLAGPEVDETRSSASTPGNRLVTPEISTI